MVEVQDDKIRNMAPPKQEYCCSLRGVNHQARDFLRAILLHLLDQLEENNKFVKFYMITVSYTGSLSRYYYKTRD